MDYISKYMSLVEQYPHVFENDERANSITVIKEESIIREYQEKFYKEAEKSNRPLFWYDLGVVAEDQWVIVLRDLVIFPNGNYGRYIRLLNKTSHLMRKGTDVVILPVLDSNILLLKHFRHDDRKWHWEVPRGFGEVEISPEDNARKELIEETNLAISSIVQISGDPLSSQSNPIEYFFATVHGSISLEENEGIDSYRFCSVEEFENMLLVGDVDDFFTIKAYTLAKIRKLI